MVLFSSYFGRCADGEILSLLTSKVASTSTAALLRPTTQGGCLEISENGPRAADLHKKHSRMQQQQQHNANNSQGTQKDMVAEQSAPTVSRKRPLPRSFKPVARAGFQPPRAKHSGGSHSSGAPVKPQGALKPQPAPRAAPQPLAQRSANQAQPPCGHLPNAQQPAPPSSVLQRWAQPGAAPATAAPHLRRLPTALATPSAGLSCAPGPAHALDELQFPGAAMHQAERLCTVPDTFQGGAQEYCHVWLAAVYEELSLQ